MRISISVKIKFKVELIIIIKMNNNGETVHLVRVNFKIMIAIFQLPQQEKKLNNKLNKKCYI